MARRRHHRTHSNVLPRLGFPSHPGNANVARRHAHQPAVNTSVFYPDLPAAVQVSVSLYVDEVPHSLQPSQHQSIFQFANISAGPDGASDEDPYTQSASQAIAVSSNDIQADYEHESLMSLWEDCRIRLLDRKGPIAIKCAMCCLHLKRAKSKSE